MSRKEKAPKRQRGRLRLVRTGYSSVIGLLALAVIAIGMIRGRLDLAAAGERAGVVLVVVAVVDNLLVPVIQVVLPRSRSSRG